MLKQFGALPTEARAARMKDRDYLWCVLNLLLDEEEELERFCPSCREAARGGACPACGAATGLTQEAENAGFDWARFEALKRGEGE